MALFLAQPPRTTNKVGGLVNSSLFYTHHVDLKKKVLLLTVANHVLEKDF